MLNFTDTGEATGLPTLLIVHGLFGSARNWGAIAKRLSSDRRVVSVDMRNHAESFRAGTQTYPEMAGDLAGVIHEIGAPVDVLGHSMGGKAAMMLALRHPDLVRRLIVADIAPAPYTHSQLPFIEAMRAVDLDHFQRRADAEEQLAALGVEPALQSFFTQSLDLAERRWRLNLDALEAEMDKIMGFPRTEARWTGPALFLSGGDSDYVRREHRPAIKALFPAARFARIPGAGHWLHADRPREFEGAVRAFLNA